MWEDFTELDENYPVSVSINLTVEDPTDITIDQHDFESHTSSWLEVEEELETIA